jgi:hypothetical protein
MIGFAAIFDKTHALRGWALQESIWTQRPEMRTFVLITDDVIGKGVLRRKDKGVIGIGIDELEQDCPALTVVREQRSWPAYVLTLKPFLLGYVLYKFKPEAVAYIDSDLYFWDDPQLVFDELNGHDVMLSPTGRHRVHMQGKYNGGFVATRGSLGSRDFVAYWGQKCLDWCDWRMGPEGWGDEQYLEAAMKKEFCRVKECAHPGINLAHWHRGARIAQNSVGFTVNGRQVVCFHYSKFTMDPHNLTGSMNVPEEMARILYPPYYEQLRMFEEQNKELFA